MKKGLIAVFCLFIAVFGVQASTISFFVVETGLPEHADTSRYSIFWENALMDVFFESGYIVSNAPIQRCSIKPTADTLEDAVINIEETLDASIDFLIIVNLDYMSILFAPHEVSFYVLKTDQHKVVYEKQIAGKNYKNEKDANEDLKTIVGEFVKFVNNF